MKAEKKKVGMFTHFVTYGLLVTYYKEILDISTNVKEKGVIMGEETGN